ncbi:unnamed protein product [Rangifer tarandus platyrhynchus]|uniref:Uncharacterized protein n=1 Tax=Rangifer tarandus platyrhynchus TaxID=3082113 RepID=A0AC59Z866_RANTA
MPRAEIDRSWACDSRQAVPAERRLCLLDRDPWRPPEKLSSELPKPTGRLDRKPREDFQKKKGEPESQEPTQDRASQEPGHWSHSVKPECESNIGHSLAV